MLYFESYIVIDPGESPLEHRELLTDARYRKAVEEYGGKFVAEMGAEAIRKLLKALDVAKLSEELHQEMRESNSEVRRKKMAKRLKVMNAFKTSAIGPSGWDRSIPGSRLTTSAGAAGAAGSRPQISTKFIAASSTATTG